MQVIPQRLHTNQPPFPETGESHKPEEEFADSPNILRTTFPIRLKEDDFELSGPGIEFDPPRPCSPNQVRLGQK